MRFFRRSLVGLLLLAVTLGLLATAAQTIRGAIEAKMSDASKAPAPRERVFSANVVTAVPAPVTPVTKAFGEIRARRTLELRSPRAGTVTFLAEGFEDGAAVTAGQLLLRLDPADATANRDLARSDLSRAGAEVRDAARALDLARDDVTAAQDQATLRQQALTRQRDLATRGVGSEAAVETAALAASAAEQAVLSRRSALAQAEARIDQAATALARQKITLAEAERALSDTELFAEFDGVLSGVSVVAGRILGANESLGELIDPTALEVAFRLSTAQYSRLITPSGSLQALPVTVSLEVSGAELIATGTLARVGAAVGTGQTGRQVFATLTGSGGFRPGDFVTIRVQEPALDAVVDLPATALGANGTVLALTDDERIEELPARLIRRLDDRVYLGADGIAGRDIVAERSPLLGTGIKVKPIRPEATDTASAEPALVTLTPERRAQLIAFVQNNSRMPADAKARILAQLAQDQVPARVIERLEQRMGG